MLNCIFISHRFFSIDRLLRLNVNYIIFTKLDKKEISMLYNDISLDLSLKEFQNINNDLKKYDFIIIR